jgi:quercetin dioxygenase-like cupin family protein
METRAQGRRQLGRETLAMVLAAVATSASGFDAFAQSKPSSAGATRREVIKQALPGEPPRELTVVEVTYAPGAGSPPHSHANGVMAFVVSGSVASIVNDGPEQTYHAGDAWWEPPGAIHRESRNASTTEPAKLLAIYIAPKGATGADLAKPL